MVFPKKLQHKLQQRKEADNFRTLSKGKGIDFFSNDYLGLAQNKELHYLNKTSLDYYTQNGSTGSRLLSGNSVQFESLEDKLAKLFQGKSALLFNTGYNANTSILQALPQKGDTILYDELIHASLKEGSRLSFAKRFAFKHNNLEDLQQKLTKAEGDKYVVVESIYSMDGDAAPLKELTKLCNFIPDTYLIVDEAHSTGIWGVNGNGLCCELGIENDVFARIYTFGKAIGCHGACVVGDKNLKEYLINFGMSFIYTTALPPHGLLAIDNAFEYLKDNTHLQKTINNKISLFKEKSKGLNIIPSDSPIQVVQIGGGNTHTKKVAQELIGQGFEVRPILSPTVKEGQERIRICLHTFNSDEAIENLVNALKTL